MIKIAISITVSNCDKFYFEYFDSYLLGGGVMGTVTYVACNPLKKNDLPIT